MNILIISVIKELEKLFLNITLLLQNTISKTETILILLMLHTNHL